MELRITKEWLAKHREEDEGHDTSAGSLMLKAAGVRAVDSMNLMRETVEGTRDEVSEKLKRFPKEQRFRLITLPWQDDTDSNEGPATTHLYAGRGRNRQRAHVAESAEEYHVAPGTKPRPEDTGC